LDFLKKYGIVILSALVLAGIFYLRYYSATSRLLKGEKLYRQHCANCHGGEGQGLKKLIPPLAGADYVSRHKKNLPCIIRYGMKDKITVNGQSYNQPMAGILILEDDQIKSIIDYMLTSWYPEEETLSQGEVREILQNCR
jgi:mono/diheme cytochrome c family protein